MNYKIIAATVMATIVWNGNTKAQENDDNKKTSYMPHVHGTIRGKYEYQNQEKEGRFEVRNARFSVDGQVAPTVFYKAEIDLSDEGSIKMLDAYTRLKPINDFQFTIGQFRVPFTIDAHRSPAFQYFANRSFIAKQVGNVRDVGAAFGYNINAGIAPMMIEAGLFNGSGLTNQKDYWTNSVNFSAKWQIFFPHGFNMTLSTQKIKPNGFNIMMYDAGGYYHAKGWHIEAEYLLKHYDRNAFHDVSAFDGFICYDIPFNKKSFFSKISPLARFDYMDDHSDGTPYENGATARGGNMTPEVGKLYVTDGRRNRITGGVTLSISKPFIADIRINYEKYHYSHNDYKAYAKASEKDKFVIEFVTQF